MPALTGSPVARVQHTVRRQRADKTLARLRGGHEDEAAADDDDDDSDGEAERRLRRRLATAPESPAVLFCYACFLTYRRLDCLRAEQLYQRVLDADGGHVGALVHYAHLKYLAFNDYG